MSRSLQWPQHIDLFAQFPPCGGCVMLSLHDRGKVAAGRRDSRRAEVPPVCGFHLSERWQDQGLVLRAKGLEGLKPGLAITPGFFTHASSSRPFRDGHTLWCRALKPSATPASGWWSASMREPGDPCSPAFVPAHPLVMTALWQGDGRSMPWGD